MPKGISGHPNYFARCLLYPSKRTFKKMVRASTGALSGREHSTAMTPEEFQKFYPLLLGWIDATLRAHAGNTRTVVSRRFPRLPLYFSTDTLTSAKVVLVDQLPIPPLSSWGLTRFADFERGSFNGITYLNTFFIKRDELRNEAIHFHELIHVVQWRILGPEQLLRSYADGLERFGYRDSPLEVMAYDAEAAFMAKDVFDAEKMVARKLS